MHNLELNRERGLKRESDSERGREERIEGDGERGRDRKKGEREWGRKRADINTSI